MNKSKEISKRAGRHMGRGLECIDAMRKVPIGQNSHGFAKEAAENIHIAMINQSRQIAALLEEDQIEWAEIKTKQLGKMAKRQYKDLLMIIRFNSNPQPLHHNPEK